MKRANFIVRNSYFIKPVYEKGHLQSFQVMSELQRCFLHPNYGAEEIISLIPFPQIDPGFTDCLIFLIREE